jgi:predicted Zn-dependent protease
MEAFVKHITRAKAGWLAMVFAAVFMCGGCDTSKLVSTQQEVEVGQQAAQKVESENRVLTGTSDARRVEEAARRVIPQADRKDVTYTVKLLDKNEVNAVALPGGYMYIYSGLLPFLEQNKGVLSSSNYDGAKVDTNDVLACVIAHEAAHVSARHHAKTMGRSAVYGAAISALNKGNVQQWAAVFANIDMLRYSRSEEYEADRLGAVFARRASYSPWGMVAFLEMLANNSSSRRSDLENILSTHPATVDRIKRARELAKELTK